MKEKYKYTLGEARIRIQRDGTLLGYVDLIDKWSFPDVTIFIRGNKIMCDDCLEEIPWNLHSCIFTELHTTIKNIYDNVL